MGLIPISAQPRVRSLVDGKTYSDAPVIVVDTKWKSSSLKAGERISADKDWLKDVQIDIKNISQKPIMAVDVMVNSLQNGEMKIVAPFIFEFRAAQRGPSHEMVPLEPGKTVTLSVLENQRLATMKFLGKQQFDDFSTVNVEVKNVFFMDGTGWINGREMRQDPNNPDVWHPVQKSPSKPSLISRFAKFFETTNLTLAMLTPVLDGRFSIAVSTRSVAKPASTPDTPSGCLECES